MQVSGGATGAIVYDPLGRIFEYTGGGGITHRFLYDGDALVAEYNVNAGVIMRRYVHGSGAGDDPLIWYGFNPGEIHWLHADHQGSIVASTDGNGAIQTINAYDEYGIPNAANAGRFQYTGQIYLPEIGLYHYKARAYSPTLGRFMQTDPIGYDDQVNLYAYVGNDPVNAVDPTGKCGAGARAVSAYGRGPVTVIICSDGLNEVRAGGSLAWRNNNPGNIEAGAFADTHGAIGRAGLTQDGRFAVFPDEGTGRTAIGDLLQSARYRNLTPEAAIRRYAPPGENDTAGYQQIVRGTIGDTGNRTVGQLTGGELGRMVTAIARVEGWQVGRVTYQRAQNGNGVARATYSVTGSRIRRSVECSEEDGQRRCR